MFNFLIVKSLVFNFFPKTPSSDRTKTLTYKLQIDMRPQNASTIVFYAVSQCPAGKTTPTTNPQHCINARIEKTTNDIPLLAKYLFTLCDDVLVDYSKCTLYDDVQICSTLCNDVQICCQRAKQNIWMLDSSTDVQFIRLSHHSLQKTTKQIKNV